MKVWGALHAPGCPALCALHIVRWAGDPTAPSRRAGVPLRPTAPSLMKPDEAACTTQVDTRVQFSKWFNELADRGLIPRCPGYERGAKLPPPDQVTGPRHAATCQLLRAAWNMSSQNSPEPPNMPGVHLHDVCAPSSLAARLATVKVQCAAAAICVYVSSLQSLLELQRQP
jgi:hypothetical protein